MLKLFSFVIALSAAEGTAREPQVPTPPAGPTAPKVEGPTAPTAPKKTEAAAPADPKKTTPAKTASDKSEKAADKSDKAADKSDKSDKNDKSEKALAEKAEKAVAEKMEKALAEKAEKPAGKTRAKVRDRATASAAPTPPSLTVPALRQEIKQSGGEDKSAPTSDRARLEQLAGEIAKAREALKQDTARLEAMLHGGGDGRMPIGDGMASPATGSAAGGAASREAMKEQILTVSKAMQGMKPEQAAAIISRLDRVLASEILRRMKPADAGAVMASIKPELAADLATTIATRKSMVEGDSKKDGKK